MALVLVQFRKKKNCGDRQAFNVIKKKELYYEYCLDFWAAGKKFSGAQFYLPTEFTKCFTKMDESQIAALKCRFLLLQ